MKTVGVISTALSLFLLLGTAAPAYAQQGDKQGNSEKQDQGKSQAKPGQQQGKQQ